MVEIGNRNHRSC